MSFKGDCVRHHAAELDGVPEENWLVSMLIEMPPRRLALNASIAVVLMCAISFWLGFVLAATRWRLGWW